MKEGDIESLPFVNYCMKRINMLRMKNIKTIVVFDGCHLPTKANVEAERRKRRLEYLKRGKEYLRDGKRSEAFDCFQKCVDVSPQMALAFIKACRSVGVECIVAPYEADAQLAFLSKSGIADVVITEDSDLLVFGCKKVLFKMSEGGDGLLVDSARLGDVEGGKLQGFSETSFRHMCILSGCDYLSSVPGMGLSTANKLLKKFGKDPLKVILHLKMQKGKTVPKDYSEGFARAEQTFLYQLVFDPRTQKQVRLNPLPENIDPVEIEFAGAEVSPRKAVGLARGNINPITFETMNHYSPSKQKEDSSSDGRGVKSVSSRGGSRVQQQGAINTMGGKFGLPTNMTKNPAISSSKKASKPFKPPAQVADKCNDQSLENDELMCIYGPSGNTEERREEPGFPEDNLSRPISNSQKRATISRFFDRLDDSQDDSTPLGSQSRMLSRLKLVAKGLTFEERRTSLTSGDGLSTGSPKKVETKGEKEQLLKTLLSDKTDSSSDVGSAMPITTECDGSIPHHSSCATDEETLNSSLPSASTEVDSLPSSSQHLDHKPRVSVRESLRAFSFSPVSSEAKSTGEPNTTSLKRPPTQCCDPSPSKRFLAQQDIVSSGIGLLQGENSLENEPDVGNGTDDSECLPDSTGNDHSSFSSVNQQILVDLTSNVDHTPKSYFLNGVKERAILSTTGRRKRPGMFRSFLLLPSLSHSFCLCVCRSE
jgi:exonuclease-1